MRPWSSTRCSRGPTASCTSPAMARRANTAASCSRATPSWGRARSRPCARCPSWCSSTAAISPRATPRRRWRGGFDRSAFAAGVADKLIEIGVRCVIAAGWAVDDGPAETFATTFYRELLAGATFVDAVGRARRSGLGRRSPAARPGPPTSATATPAGPFVPAAAMRRRWRRPVGDQFEGISSAAGPDAGARGAGDADSRYERCRGRALSSRRCATSRRVSRALWGGMGAVAEAFGVACADAGDVERRSAWYERALLANDASASLKAREQVGQSARAARLETVARRGAHRAALVQVAGRIRRRHCAPAVAGRPAPDRGAAVAVRLGVEAAVLLDAPARRMPTPSSRPRCSGRRRLPPAPRKLAATRLSGPVLPCAEPLGAGAGAAWRRQPAGPGWTPARKGSAAQSLLARTQSDPDFWSWSVRSTSSSTRPWPTSLAAQPRALAEGYADIARARELGQARGARSPTRPRFVLEARGRRAARARNVALRPTCWSAFWPTPAKHRAREPASGAAPGGPSAPAGDVDHAAGGVTGFARTAARRSPPPPPRRCRCAASAPGARVAGRGRAGRRRRGSRSR